MKKPLALLAAAVFAFSAAGCLHKEPTPQGDGTSESQTTVSEELGSLEVSESAEESSGKHSSDNKHTKITLYSTRATSPDRLTQRPTTTERTTIPVALPSGHTTRPQPSIRPGTTAGTTARVTTTRHTTTAKPTTTAPNPLVPAQTTAPFKAPVVEYSGVYGSAEDSVRIKSHVASRADSGSVMLTITFEIVSCSGKYPFVEIGYDCYDAAGNKINDKTVRCIAPVKVGQAEAVAIATAPQNTAKIVFKNI